VVLLSLLGSLLHTLLLLQLSQVLLLLMSPTSSCASHSAADGIMKCDWPGTAEIRETVAATAVACKLQQRGDLECATAQHQGRQVACSGQVPAEGM
jgi:hypothetical protein